MLIDLDHLIGTNWSDIRQAARAFLAQSQPNAFEQAITWYAHSAWEVRSFALVILGGLAAGDPRASAFLFERWAGTPYGFQVRAGACREGRSLAAEAICVRSCRNAAPSIHRYLGEMLPYGQHDNVFR